MKPPSVVLDLSLVFETVIRLDASNPEQLQEDVRRVNDFLNDLSELLSRYS